MKAIDLSNIQEASSGSNRPAPGAYECKITDVKDDPDKEYLVVSYDIAAGEYEGYYTKLREDHPEWSGVGVCYRSYKSTALPMFKRFCSAVNKSNNGFVFDGGSVNADEKTLIGKHLGMVFREEEYYGNDGNKKTRLIVDRECPVDKIGDMKVPPIKALSEEANIAYSGTSTGAESVPWS